MMIIVDGYACWIGLPEELCCCGTEQEILYINPGAEFTTGTDSSVGRALVMIADDAGSILAQSTIFHDIPTLMHNLLRYISPVLAFGTERRYLTKDFCYCLQIEPNLLLASKEEILILILLRSKLLYYIKSISFK